MLLAIRQPDNTIRLVESPSITDAVRDMAKPVVVWVLTGARRVVVTD